MLDRDGTLNVNPARHEYVMSPDEFTWLPGARQALARLAAAGYALGVASNQRGIARGLFGCEVLRSIERRMADDLRPLGVRVEAFRYCPHDLDAGCDCRKPKPGLLRMLADDLDVDLADSWMVGDSAADVAAGRAAGCRTAIVGDGTSAEADICAASLVEFAELIAAGPAEAGAPLGRRPRTA